MALTIIEAAAEKKLTTLMEARQACGVTDSSADVYLFNAIEIVSDTISRWCKRIFAVETVRESIYPDKPGKSLMLSRWPVVAITAVTVNGAAEDIANVEAEDSGHLFRIDASGCRTLWPSGRIVVEYSAGYVLPDKSGRTLPLDIERAALITIRADWFARSRDPLIRSETIEMFDIERVERSYSPYRTTALPPDAEALLTSYRSSMF
jgi:hypothetical protein